MTSLLGFNSLTEEKRPTVKRETPSVILTL